jgi:sulfonate transport system ATP-binding protein
MLTLDHVSKTYANGVQALDRVSAQVRHGEVVAIVGASGCGKSTLLRIASGLEAPTRGAVTLDGTVITSPHEKIGIVFQEPRLLPWLSVADNVGFGLTKLPRQARARAVSEILERVGLADKAGAWPRELSGGQAQRVAIARALVACPSVLLLDEPFSALDAFTRAELQDHLLDLWAETKPTLILVTHDIEEALVLASRVVVMRTHPGQIAESFDVALDRPRDPLSPAFEAQKKRIVRVLHSTIPRRRQESVVQSAA